MEISKGLSLGLSKGHVQPPVAAAADEIQGMIYLSAWMYDSVDQGTWAILVVDTVVRNALIYNTTDADNDAVSYKDYMPAGTYTCKIIAQKGSNRGILKLKIDGTTVVTWDQYAAAATPNQLSTTTGIVVETSGVKTIQMIVDGKNASSSGYTIGNYEIVFYRTS